MKLHYLALLTFLAAPLSLADGHKEPPPSIDGGYLGPEVYEKLEAVESSTGRMVRRWVGPKLSFANYQKVLVAPVIFHPEPPEDAQINQENLEAARAYFTLKMKERVGHVLLLADEPGPGVLQIQPAITGVDIKTQGMKGYEVVPVAAIMGGLKAATGNRKRDVRIFVEAKVTDSVTGEIIGAAVERTKVESLKNKREELELDHMQGKLDGLAEEARVTLEQLLQAQE